MQLGFHPPLSRLYVFIKNEAGCLWYWLDDGQKRYIQYTAITGTLKRFEIKESQTSFGNEEKADFEIIADRRYVLRSGTDTAFTKGMLMIASALSDDRIKRPVTLELKAGDEKGNVLVSCRDPETFEPILTGKWENANWDELMESAIARLGGSQPQPSAPQPQTKPQPQRQGYPQHNSLIKSVRAFTGHTSEQIVGWCRQYGASQPSELSPAECNQLVEALCVGWGKQFFASEQHAANSFRGHVQSRIAAGVAKFDAVESWIESARAVPAR